METTNFKHNWPCVVAKRHMAVHLFLLLSYVDDVRTRRLPSNLPVPRAPIGPLGPVMRHSMRL
eukprot:scaffold66935_cov52-Attheya_sp.AAC.5